MKGFAIYSSTSSMSSKQRDLESSLSSSSHSYHVWGTGSSHHLHSQTSPKTQAAKQQQRHRRSLMLWAILGLATTSCLVQNLLWMIHHDCSHSSSISSSGGSSSSSMLSNFLGPLQPVKVPQNTSEQVQEQSSASVSSHSKYATAPYDIFGPSPSPLTALAVNKYDADYLNVLRAKKFSLGGGGQDDPKHLGGFGAFDKTTISPTVWKYMMQELGVKSVLDIGCGRGWSTSWFLHQKMNALCVEGSHDAVSQSALLSSSNHEALASANQQHPYLVEHDFARGPWWPSRTYDAAWVTDVVQQISMQHAPNYLPALRKAALLFVTAPIDAGWHHVEVHTNDWWIQRFERWGWKFEGDLTTITRAKAEEDNKSRRKSPDGTPYYPQSVINTVMVFSNPDILRLPQHAHLFPELGCFQSRGQDGSLVQRECAVGAGAKQETPVHKSLAPLSFNPAGEHQWIERVKKLLNKRRPLLPRIVTQASNVTTTLVDDDFAIEEEDLDLPPIDHSLNFSSHAVGKSVAAWLSGESKVMPQAKVMAWPMIEFGPINSESQHIVGDGICESQFLELATDMFDFDPNIVWVGDRGFGHGWGKWCDKFNELVQVAQQRRANRGLPTQWPIVIVHFGDGAGYPRCSNVEESIGAGMVRYTMRSLAKTRKWKDETQWVDIGVMLNMTNEGINYLHTPLVVRTDTVAAFEETLQERQLSLSSSMEQIDRPLDITHFWPATITGDGSDGVGTVESNLRTRVSQLIVELEQDPSSKVDGRRLAVYTGLAGRASSHGRSVVARDYIEGLLKTKIIVITQRDGWEDHYRLFEGMISGALVLTDRMHGLPEGLEHGKHLVEFDGAQDFKDKAMYYLQHKEEREAIAFRGRKASMERHRSWHRIEEIVFGQPLTRCQSGASPCPFIVHVNESSTTATI